MRSLRLSTEKASVPASRHAYYATTERWVRSSAKIDTTFDVFSSKPRSEDVIDKRHLIYDFIAGHSRIIK